jgi:hypothetical protein
MTEKNVIKFYPKHIRETKSALKALKGLSDEEAIALIEALSDQFIEEIKQGLEGEVDYEDAPFYEMVNKLYEESQVKGCYFCDRDIQGNDIPFDVNTPICMSCELKVANFMVAFGIDPRVLFPAMGDRKKQQILFEKAPRVVRPKGVAVH